MAKMTIVVGKEKQEIDLFEFTKKEIVVLDGGYEYKPVYGGTPHIPNAWSVVTAIQDKNIPDSEWYLQIEGAGRRVTFFEIGFGTGYDFEKRRYDIGREKFFSGTARKFKKDFLGLRLFILRQLPGRFLRNPDSGKLIRKLVSLSISIIKDYSSMQIDTEKWMKSWGSRTPK